MFPTLRNYQRNFVKHILEHEGSGLFIGMGSGKTLICLEAIHLLKSKLPTLVIAPKSVCRAVWEAEIKKWEYGFTYCVLDGDPNDRKYRLSLDRYVYIISRDMVVWLYKNYPRKEWGMIIVDESTSFKNYTAQRTKALAKIIFNSPKRVLLSGTPTANSLIDLWAQVFMLDKGVRLGRNVTSFKTLYFRPTLTINNIPVKYEVREEMKEKLLERISDICISKRSDELVELPDVSYNDIIIPISDSLSVEYKTFVRTKVLPSAVESVYAMTMAALTQKLLQFTNGFTYENEGGKAYPIHKLKLDWVKEFADTTTSKALLFYNFVYDREVLLKELGKNAMWLKEAGDIDTWRKNDCAIALAHPASMGFGLNLADTTNICIWYGLTWNAEQYEQANARVIRHGQLFKCQIYHLMLANTIDEKVLKVLKTKAELTESVLEYLRKEFTM